MPVGGHLGSKLSVDSGLAPEDPGCASLFCSVSELTPNLLLQETVLLMCTPVSEG